MRKTRKFDCVKMKEQIHAKLDREFRGLTDRQISERIRRKLATSNNEVARWWREMLAGGTTADKPAAHSAPHRRRVLTQSRSP